MRRKTWENAMPRLRAYGYARLTTAFFLLSLAGH